MGAISLLLSEAKRNPAICNPLSIRSQCRWLYISGRRQSDQARASDRREKRLEIIRWGGRADRHRGSAPLVRNRRAKTQTAAANGCSAFGVISRLSKGAVHYPHRELTGGEQRAAKARLPGSLPETTLKTTGSSCSKARIISGDFVGRVKARSSPPGQAVSGVATLRFDRPGDLFRGIARLIYRATRFGARGGILRLSARWRAAAARIKQARSRGSRGAQPSASASRALSWATCFDAIPVAVAAAAGRPA